MLSTWGTFGFAMSPPVGTVAFATRSVAMVTGRRETGASGGSDGGGGGGSGVVLVLEAARLQRTTR